ncbi:MAG: hypothetical protein ACREBF_02200 [Candidatus Micrarchaeales archaeon]
MPSITIPSANLQIDGPNVEVQFLVPRQIEEQYRKEGKTIPAPISIKALIDTGATNCVVRQDIPNALGLQPVDVIGINTPSSKNHRAYRYFMRMIIPSTNITYEGLFTALPLDGQNISSLIGRDLLAFGLLIYIGNANQFTLSLL